MNPLLTLFSCFGKKLRGLQIACMWLTAISCSPVDSEKLTVVEKWRIFELALEGPSEGNPYMEVALSAVFSHKDTEIKVPGYYDGNGDYYIRFSPPETGEWSYITQSNEASLAEQQGKFKAVDPTGSNHGPVEVYQTHYLRYADGSPYFAVGTTAYQWTSVDQHIQEKTLATLEEAPFNKIRMCVFPKSYIYGNEVEPWAYPFFRENEENDFSRPNFEFFQNFERRLAQLQELGIQADVILFHPYDRWGYSSMGATWNERYVRYVMARFSAYSNLWWSLANEWDVPEIKDAIDWEGLGTLLQQEDPHQRLRGIHNWYGSEDHFYDHTAEWITHTSTQTSQFYNAERWREKYGKPLLFDEMRYEGDVPSGWGNLSGEEMASYFWMAAFSGGYPTHGDTYENKADDQTEVRWWAKGGLLAGSSPDRIAYFKQWMQQTPFSEMKPKLIPGEDPENLSTNQYYLSLDQELYWAYAAASGQQLQITLTGETPYQLQVIDTWNQKVVEEQEVISGNFSFQTKQPYTAIRLERKRASP